MINFNPIFVGVGKTCLVRRFTQGMFPPGQGATIGVDFMIKTVEIEGEKIKVSYEKVCFASENGCQIVRILQSVHFTQSYIFCMFLTALTS